MRIACLLILLLAATGAPFRAQENSSTAALLTVEQADSEARENLSFLHIWLPNDVSRLSPITVGATVLALFPLAVHGGPLWQPLCYAQIGGLSVATFIMLLLVPVLYSVFVLDLKIVEWSGPNEQAPLADAQSAKGELH